MLICKKHVEEKMSYKCSLLLSGEFNEIIIHVNHAWPLDNAKYDDFTFKIFYFYNVYSFKLVCQEYD